MDWFCFSSTKVGDFSKSFASRSQMIVQESFQTGGREGGGMRRRRQRCWLPCTRRESCIIHARRIVCLEFMMSSSSSTNSSSGLTYCKVVQQNYCRESDLPFMCNQLENPLNFRHQFGRASQYQGLKAEKTAQLMSRTAVATHGVLAAKEPKPKMGKSSEIG